MAIDSHDAAPKVGKTYQLIAGELCLDLCNTMGGKREGIPREILHSYPEFLDWCEQAQILSADEAAALRQQQAQQAGDAAEVLRRVIELREAIYRIFFGLSRDVSPSADDLAILNQELARSLNRLEARPAQGGKGFEWAWRKEHMSLDYPLGPLAYSAANLLMAQADCCRVRQCHGENCGWLFLDASKNHTRCWCDMRDCGNRAKVRRHRQRSRQRG